MLETYNLYVLIKSIRIEEYRMNVTDPVKALLLLFTIGFLGQACGWF